jgi:meiotic recombination protein SPO11
MKDMEIDWMSENSGGFNDDNEDDDDDSQRSSFGDSQPSLSQCSDDDENSDDDDSSSLAPTAISQIHEISSDEVIRRIEDLAASFIDTLADDSLPFPILQTILHPAAHDDDDDSNNNQPTSTIKQILKRFTALHQSRSYTSIWLVLSFCHQLLQSNRTATNREVYYHYITHFRKQRECDAAILDAALLLQVPRMALGLKASPKGWFIGSFVLESCTSSDDESDHDTEPHILCDGRKLSSSNGLPITSEWLMGQRRRNFTVRTTDDCICILVIEKEGVYNRLAEDRFFDEYPCIMVCGKGFPDLATRACVYTLAMELNLPVWGVADCDPYGMLVLHCYMYSNNTQLGVDGGSRYGVPIHWIGLRPSQIPHIATDEKELPNQCLVELTEKDRKILESMLAREDHRWTNLGQDERRMREIEIMLEDGYKVELEAFNWMGMHYFSEWLGNIFERHLRAEEQGLLAGADDLETSDEGLGWMEII